MFVFNNCDILDSFASLAMTVIALRRDKQVALRRDKQVGFAAINTVRGAKRRSQSRMFFIGILIHRIYFNNNK